MTAAPFTLTQMVSTPLSVIPDVHANGVFIASLAGAGTNRLAYACRLACKPRIRAQQRRDWTTPILTPIVPFTRVAFRAFAYIARKLFDLAWSGEEYRRGLGTYARHSTEPVHSLPYIGLSPTR